MTRRDGGRAVGKLQVKAALGGREGGRGRGREGGSSERETPTTGDAAVDHISHTRPR